MAADGSQAATDFLAECYAAAIIFTMRPAGVMCSRGVDLAYDSNLQLCAEIYRAMETAHSELSIGGLDAFLAGASEYDATTSPP